MTNQNPSGAQQSEKCRDHFEHKALIGDSFSAVYEEIKPVTPKQSPLNLSKVAFIFCPQPCPQENSSLKQSFIDAGQIFAKFTID
jgi:hypothetical protein